MILQEEMDIQVLRFQNKKLGERLEEMKFEEENLKIQIEEYKKRERDNTELLSVIHRAWNQVIHPSRKYITLAMKPHFVYVRLVKAALTSQSQK